MLPIQVATGGSKPCAAISADASDSALAGLALAVLPRRGRQGFQTIFDGESGKGWMLYDQKPLPKANVQADGLNPHGSGGYIVVHDRSAGDFVLDFDYKLTQGLQLGRLRPRRRPEGPGEHRPRDRHSTTRPAPACTTRRLLRPGRPQDQRPEAGRRVEPHDDHRPGAEDHGRPQRRGGHQRSTSTSGPTPGKRPDGSKHKFANVAIGKLPRTGYFGFQDHGSDCWYKNVKIKALLKPAQAARAGHEERPDPRARTRPQDERLRRRR